MPNELRSFLFNDPFQQVGKRKATILGKHLCIENASSKSGPLPTLLPHIRRLWPFGRTAPAKVCEHQPQHHPGGGKKVSVEIWPRQT